MKYLDETPHPLIEDHYHIRELFENQDKRVADREHHRQRIKDLEERENLIKDSKLATLTDWWCDECKEDFKSVGVRFIETDWSNRSQRVAFYRTKCFKGHWVVRWITDKWRDPYWEKSKWVANDRTKHANDVLQEFQSGYTLMNTKKNG